jgi:hypothetical protein
VANFPTLMARRAAVVAVLATLGGLVPVRSTLAFVTIGSDLGTDGFLDNCNPQPCTETVLQLLQPARIVTAPGDGVVTRWAVRSMSGPIQLRVLRPAPGNAFHDVGSSGQVTAVGPGVQTFSTRIAIRAGDYVGVDALAGAFLAYRAAPGGMIGDYYPGRLPDGATSPLTNGTVADYEVLLSVDVEPDADGDGFGDETQDGCPTDPTTHDTCPDRTAPTTSLGGAPKQNIVRQKAVIVTAQASEAATLDATGTIRVRGRRGLLELTPASASAAAGAEVSLELKLPETTLRLVRRALRKGRRVEATVSVSVRDAAGNEGGPVETTVRAKRRRR